MNRTIHFIHGLNGDPWGFIEHLAVCSAARHNPDWNVVLHLPADYPRANSNWYVKTLTALPLGARLTIMPTPACDEWRGVKVKHYAHRADLLRHSILFTYGGVYLDTDTVTLAPFPEEWLKHDTAIGHEYDAQYGTVGCCNAVMAARQFSEFQWLWLNEWRRFVNDGWNTYSVAAPELLRQKHPDLCRRVEWDMLGPMWWQISEHWKPGAPKGVVWHLWRSYNGNAHRLAGLEQAARENQHGVLPQIAKQYL